MQKKKANLDMLFSANLKIIYLSFINNIFDILFYFNSYFFSQLIEKIEINYKVRKEKEKGWER